MQLSPRVLPPHKCFNEEVPLFIRIYHLLFLIRGHTVTTSTKNDQFCANPPPPPLPPAQTPDLQKWTTDLLFKNNRICKHRTNYKTSFHVDVINVWFLKWFQVNLFQLWLKAAKKRVALFQSLAAHLVQLSLNTVKNLLL